MFHLVRRIAAVSILTFFSVIAQAGEPVNINEADAASLALSLSGVGEAKAQAIVEYRNTHGRFNTAADLVKVKGIGAKLLERNRALITLGKAPVSKAQKTPAADAGAEKSAAQSGVAGS